MAFGLLCCPWLLAFPCGVFYMRSLFINRVLKRLHPDTDAELRSRLGGRWGMLPSIRPYRKFRPSIMDKFDDVR